MCRSLLICYSVTGSIGPCVFIADNTAFKDFLLDELYEETAGDAECQDRPSADDVGSERVAVSCTVDAARIEQCYDVPDEETEERQRSQDLDRDHEPSCRHLELGCVAVNFFKDFQRIEQPADGECLEDTY